MTDTTTLAPLKQSEQLTVALGCGAATLYECSNRSAQQPLPRLTLMVPAVTEVLNEGHSDAIVAHYPAQSLELMAKATRQLYELLHAYYRRSGQHLTS